MKPLLTFTLGAVVAATALPTIAGATSPTSHRVVVRRGYGPVATCPAGYTLSGGTARPADPRHDWLTADQPHGNGWTGDAMTHDPNLNATLHDTVTVYAICVH